jgi:hypothetical protein
MVWKQRASPPNMALQRTRRPRIRSGRSLRSLGSPLNARPLGATRACTAIGAVAVGLFLLVVGCSDRASQLVLKINNADIAWDGTFVGLVPRIEGEASKSVLTLGNTATPALVAVSMTRTGSPPHMFSLPGCE